MLLRLNPVALARSRFALSPLAETFGSLLSLTRPCPDPWLTHWHARNAPQLQAILDQDPFLAGLLALLGSTKWLPDFVALAPPNGMTTTLAAELPAVAAFTDAQVRASLAESVQRSWREHDLGWLAGTGLAPRIAEFFELSWTRFVAADWPRRRSLLERDVTYRAGLLAAYGWPRALQQMSRHSEWVGADSIRFTSQPGPDRVIGGDGVIFVPISQRRSTWLCEWDGRHALVYPARGVAATGHPPEVGSLQRLIGAGRARILTELHRPATSTELAAALGLSLGTVGGHLAVLREAGLVRGDRLGRRVLYRRTELAEQLAAGSS